MQSIDELPDFDAPPAVETVMGFYFIDLPTPPWTTLRLGQYWERVSSSYPKATTLPPIGTTNFHLPNDGPTFDFPVRANFANQSESELIQVQHSGFFRNWRKREDSQSYESFNKLLPSFKRDWQHFVDFLAEKKIGAPSIYRAEVTYVNHLIRGRDWEQLSDIASMLRPVGSLSNEVSDRGIFSKQLTITFSASFLLESSNVELEITLVPGLLQTESAQEVLALTISAKAPVEPSEPASAWSEIDKCHRAVIQSFANLLTPKGQQHFRRTK